MKKLTAGILATLIGLVSANSAEAAVASTTYVEDRIEALDSEKAYGNDAIGSATYIKSINEQNGIITASEGTLSDVAMNGIVEGDGIDFSKDGNGATVITADVIATPGENNLIKVEKVTTDNGDVQLQISAEKQTFTDTNTTYGFTDSETVVFDETTDDAGNVTVTANAYLDKLNVENAGDVAASTDYTSWYSLMRKCTGVDTEGLPTGCVYQWESVVREYSTDTQQ